MVLNQAKINGLSLHSAYGVGIESGLKNMDRPPELKDAEVYDWGDQNGSEYNLTDRYKDTDVTLNCFMKADSMTEFNANKQALTDMLRMPAMKTFENLISGKAYLIKYNKMSDYDWISTRPGSLAAKFKLDLTIIRGGTNTPETKASFVIDDNMVLSLQVTTGAAYTINEQGELIMTTNE